MAIVWETGFETGTPAEIFDTIVESGGVSIQSTYKNSGTYALQVVHQAGGSSYCRKDIDWETTVVARVYIRFDSIYTGDSVGYIRFLGGSSNAYIGIRASGDGGYLYYYDTVAGTVNSNVVAETGHWYCIDFRSNGSTSKFDWQIDGSAQTQLSNGVGDVYGLDIGVFDTVATDIQVDDVAYSLTDGDYPLGPTSTTASNVVYMIFES